MAELKMLDGNGAAVEFVSRAGVGVVAAYPITPQSSIAEKLSELVDVGKMDASYMRVESEHSALSVALGAQLTGVRAATATSSVGLALMHEICNAVSGMRVPIVMPVVNRALASPWSLWCDHQDSMAERDSGWLQLYCENIQEIVDLGLMAYRVAEHEKVMLPAMVCLDGFFLSHSMQRASVPDQADIDAFIGPYQKKNIWLDAADPIFINDLISMEEFTEMKYQMAAAFGAARGVYDAVAADYAALTGRHYPAVEGFLTEDAEVVIVAMGSMAGTAKYTALELRKRGVRAGVCKVTLFRPFPADAVRAVIGGIPNVAVFDRSAGLGAVGGPLYQEVHSALAGSDKHIVDYIGGLGGRDVSTGTLERVFDHCLSGEIADGPVWIDVKENPMAIREVLRRV